MPHDANGHEIKPGDHVTLKARVEEVYPSETACNVRIKIDAPDGEPSAVLSQINTKSLSLANGWKKGPLPAGTYDFGGIVKVGDDPKMGFYFADFRGDHALLFGGEKNAARIEADHVAIFNNSLSMPPDMT